MKIGKQIIGTNKISSLKVAKMFGKKHKNVLRDIKSLNCSTSFGRLNFEPTSYKDKWNRNQRCYNMTHKGFKLLTMAYCGKSASQLRENCLNHFDKSSYIEIKRGKYISKIYGNELIEIICPRCGEVNTYDCKRN